MFTLTVETSNAAFGDEPVLELVRILAEVSEALQAGHTRGTVRDENGNRVGSYMLRATEAVR